MAFDFPNSPTVDQIYTPVGGPQYRWDGMGWQKVPTYGGPAGPVGPAGPTGPAGPQGPEGVAGGVPEAPTDGKVYGRRGQDTSWQTVVGGATISDTPPASPAVGQFWLESDSGGLFVRWADANSEQWVQVNPSLDVSGLVKKTGDTMSGALGLAYPAPANDTKWNEIVGYCGANKRWAIYPGGGETETGGNAGGNFTIERFNDAGVYIDGPLFINRATGVVTATGLPRAPTGNVTIGQWSSVAGTVGSGLTLPAGGTWAWAIWGYSNSSFLIAIAQQAGVHAGGTVIWGGTAGAVATGFVWRIA